MATSFTLTLADTIITGTGTEVPADTIEGLTVPSIVYRCIIKEQGSATLAIPTSLLAVNALSAELGDSITAYTASPGHTTATGSFRITVTSSNASARKSTIMVVSSMA